MTEFEIRAQDLIDLLSTTIPLAGADATLPNINCVMLRCEDGYLTATATDRYVAGKVRFPIDATRLAPEPRWSFPIGLADAKTLLKLARENRRGAARFVDNQDGFLDMPMSARSFREFGISERRRPGTSGFPSVDSVLARTLSRCRRTPQAVAMIDPRRVAQFSTLTKLLYSQHGRYPSFWDASPDGTDATSPAWGMRFGDLAIGVVMGARPGAGDTADTLTGVDDWFGPHEHGRRSA